MSELKRVRFGLVGIGGYGASYVTSLLTLEREGLAAITSLVIRTRGKYPEQEQQLAGHKAPIHTTLEEMLAKDRKAMDIVAIPTGIDSHREQMILAAKAGLHVVLEKPSTATVQDLDAMEAALKRCGTFCQIGFQNQFAPNVMGLKRAICDGRLGEIKEVVVRGFWMRDNTYYERNPWAGKLRSEKAYILDGSINNPMAHYLFNGLYFASMKWGQAAMPRHVRAELYHAHDIESEDTSCLEVKCTNGATVYFYGTLAATKSAPISIEVIGTKGRAVWDSSYLVNFYKGRKIIGQMLEHSDTRNNVFRNAARFFQGIDPELYCPLAMTRAHVLAVNGAFLSTGKPAAIPAEALTVRRVADPIQRVVTVINDIEGLIARASSERALLSDIGVPWATRTKAVNVSKLKKFQLPE